jgi:hypothetical protein
MGKRKETIEREQRQIESFQKALNYNKGEKNKMIEDKDKIFKIAESPKEALVTTAIQNSERRLLEMELSIELEKVVLEYLNNRKV